MYNTIYNILESKFNFVKGNRKDYYCNSLGQVVASIDNNSITMFYDFPKNSTELWNHHGKVVATFVKNFNINGVVSDVFYVTGLVGTTNDAMVHEDYFLDLSVNEDIVNNKMIQKIEELPRNEQIELLKQMTNLRREKDLIEKLYEDGESLKLGSCGTMRAEDGFASFDICGLIHINNCRIANWDRDNIRNSFAVPINKNESYLNLVRVNGKKDYVDYNLVYDFYRNQYEWAYCSGIDTRGSDAIREYVESRKNMTVDERCLFKNLSISFNENALTDLRDKVEYLYSMSGVRSTNAVKLQIMREIQCDINRIKQLASSANVTVNANGLIKNLDFNKRKVDIRKKSR